MSNRRDRTMGIITGALLSAINDHGAIERHLVPSAAKRIAEQLASAAANGGAVLNDADAASAIDSLRRRYEKLKHGNLRTLDQLKRCQAERDRLRVLVDSLVPAVAAAHEVAANGCSVDRVLVTTTLSNNSAESPT